MATFSEGNIVTMTYIDDDMDAIVTRCFDYSFTPVSDEFLIHNYFDDDVTDEMSSSFATPDSDLVYFIAPYYDDTASAIIGIDSSCEVFYWWNIGKDHRFGNECETDEEGIWAGTGYPGGLFAF